MENKWKDIYNMCTIKTPGLVDKEWYKKNVIHPILDLISSSLIIEGHTGMIALKNTIFPDIEPLSI